MGVCKRSATGPRTSMLGGALVATALAGLTGPAWAAVAIFDGFGDADLNNNGVAAEPIDTDVSGSGNGTVAPYVAIGNGGSPAVYPLDTMVNEVTAAEDPGDTGIRWYSIGGWTGAPTPSPTSSPRAAVKIISDAASSLPDANSAIGYFSAGPGANRVAEAIDDGLALAWDSKGRGNNAAGFFNSRIQLGSQVGDEVKVSFDYRLWFSAANFNTNASNHIPAIGELRFGVYQDTDNQLGQSNPKAGRLATASVDDPAVWGQADGNFRGDAGANTLAGANRDHGWFVRLAIDDPENNSINQLPVEDVNRINEEINEGTDSGRIMNGATDFVAGAPAGFAYLDIDKVYHLSLSLKRYDDPATPETTGDTIFSEVTVTERATGQSFSFSGFESVVNATTPDAGGAESDSWDYFTMTTGGTSTSDDLDWLIDNFSVEVNGSNAPAQNNADFNNDNVVDGRDFLIWQSGFGLTGQTGKSNGNANSDTVVDGLDFAAWKAKFGGAPADATGSGVPEPAGAAMIIGALACLAGRRRLWI